MASIKERARAASLPNRPTLLWANVLGAGLFLVVVIFIPPWGEPFTIPKIAVATIAAFAMLPLLWVRRRQFRLNRWPLGLAAGFALLAVASAVFSGAPVFGALWGEWARRSGLISCLVLVVMVTVGSVLTRAEIRRVLTWLVWAGIPACVYGLVQLVGADPFPWTDEGWVVSTFGNPNFAAAGLSMLALLTAGLAIAGGFGTPWRLLMAPLAALEALLAIATGSSLAVFAMAAGGLLGAIAWVLRGDGPRRRVTALALLGAGFIGGGLTLWGLLGAGPLASAVSPDTLQFRRWYWGAGLRMVQTHPLFGVGPDGYGRFYGESRSQEAARMFGDGANHAHDVPLQWAATLGLPAAVLYVALVATVAAVLLKRLWKAGPEVSPLVIPLLAAWGAYQVQSLVSIDETAVSVMGWFFMGALLAVSPTAIDTGAATHRGLVLVAAASLGLVGLLIWIPPLMTSNSTRTVVQGTTEADVREAISLIEGGLVPCAGTTQVAQWVTSVAPSEATVGAVYGYVARDDRCYMMLAAAANFAIQLKDAERAVAFASHAVEIDPLNYYPWLLLAEAENLAGNRDEAQRALEGAAALVPAGDGEVWKVADELGLFLPQPTG